MLGRRLEKKRNKRAYKDAGGIGILFAALVGLFAALLTLYFTGTLGPLFK